MTTKADEYTIRAVQRNALLTGDKIKRLIDDINALVENDRRVDSALLNLLQSEVQCYARLIDRLENYHA